MLSLLNIHHSLLVLKPLKPLKSNTANMKVLSLAAATALMANQAAAHYIWTELEIDGTNGVGAEGGIRQHTNGNSPVTGKA